MDPAGAVQQNVAGCDRRDPRFDNFRIQNVQSVASDIGRCLRELGNQIAVQIGRDDLRATRRKRFCNCAADALAPAAVIKAVFPLSDLP